jgi:uncharacterized membrane protein YgcG
MASADFEKICVQDDLLLTTDKVRYAVFKGAQNITPSQYNAISKSSSSITFNVQLPSESTVFSRRIMVETVMTIAFTATPTAAMPVGQTVVNLGYASALGPFPFHSCCSTIQATINNNTVSQNQRDVMFQMLRFGDRREVARYNNATPTQYDSYWSYTDALGANNNPNSAWNDCALDQDFQPRGGFTIENITGNLPRADAADLTPRNITITYRTREPLMLSPFIWTDPESNNQGMYGVQTLNFVFNLGQANRAIRLANGNVGTTGNFVANPWFNIQTGSAVVSDVVSSELLMLFLTRQPSNLVSARNVLPFAEYPRYLTRISPAFVVPAPVAGTLPTFDRQSQTFQSIQLNSVPDKMILVARKVQANQTPCDADSFLPIRNININFNNKSGLLSGATQWDLWRMSVESGSNQTWAEYSGRAFKSSQAGTENLPIILPTCGSVLALEFGRHIELDDVYAPGSIGAFQLQFRVELENNTGLPIGANEYELVLITMNSGVLAIERGTSQTYTAILSRADVLAVSSRPQYAKSGLARIVGGAVEDKMKMLARPLMEAVGMGTSGGGLSGGGSSGGGLSGGGMSGGKMAKHLNF